MTVRFDDSLPILARVIAEELGETELQAGTVLRDMAGCLAFFANQTLDDDTIDRLSSRLSEKLGGYARTDRAIVSSDDYGSATVRQDPSTLSIAVGMWRLNLVDRRLVGADWLRQPSPRASPPPRFVFASLKGGVGRTTALVVVAAHLAAHGHRVLAVDLDMEAPGLGPMLLNELELPEFGLIDALVENGRSGLDPAFYADLVGPSSLAGGNGYIGVVPALGKRSIDHPADVLGKIARAYMEDLSPNGSAETLTDQVHNLINELTRQSQYDAVLIDARAGLHETTASAILGLGAEVLLFGLNEAQTFQGYNIMFAHLARFVPPYTEPSEWVERLTMIQGKAPADADKRMEFAQRCQDLVRVLTSGPMSEVEPVEVPLPPDGSFKEVPWDDGQPDAVVLSSLTSMLEPVAILYDGQFQGFDPLRQRDSLSERLYQTTFGDLLKWIDENMAAPQEAEP